MIPPLGRRGHAGTVGLWLKGQTGSVCCHGKELEWAGFYHVLSNFQIHFWMWNITGKEIGMIHHLKKEDNHEAGCVKQQMEVQISQ